MPSSPLWTPAELPNKTLWLDALDSSTLTLNGSKVSQWRDKSGFNRHAVQPLETNQPTYTLDNKPSIYLNGTTDFMTGNVGDTFFTDSISVFFVFKPTIVNPTFQIFTKRLNASNGFALFRIAATNSLGFDLGGFNNRATVNGYDLAVNRDEIINIQRNLINRSVYAGDGLTGSYSSGDQSLINSGNIFRFGTHSPATINYTGFIKEILFINSDLSNQDRARVAGYMAHRWGLQSLLINSHPYKNIAPRR